jgi:hypothetical protein
VDSLEQLEKDQGKETDPEAREQRRRDLAKESDRLKAEEDKLAGREGAVFKHARPYSERAFVEAHNKRRIPIEVSPRFLPSSGDNGRERRSVGAHTFPPFLAVGSSSSTQTVQI